MRIKGDEKRRRRRVRATPIAGRAIIEPLESRTLFSSVVINNLQPAALDIPRINAVLQRTPGGDPLSGTDVFGDSTINLVGFYDTGTSGVDIGSDNAQQFGVQNEVVNGQTVTATDVGVNGSDVNNVSEPLYVSLAPSESPNVDDPSTFMSVYNEHFGPIRAEVGALPIDPVTLQESNLFGMPTLAGKDLVMDMRHVNSVAAQQNFQLGTDFVSSYVYDAGTPYHPSTLDTDPGIVPTGLHVQLSYGSFDQFTAINPSGAPGPTFADNPFVGPNPVAQLSADPPPDNTPPVAFSFGGQSAMGSFLFDTGAQESFISRAEAAKLGVSYAPGTFGTANANLVDSSGHDLPNQFQAMISGAGGSTQTIAGFFLDSLTVQTTEGTPITFQGAPVLVNDVTVKDPATSQTLTIDGDFGMNFLTATAQVNSTDPLNPFSMETPGAFDWVVFDQTNGTIGLQPAGSTGPMLNNAIKLPAGMANSVILRAESGGQIDDVWINAPTTAAPTQMADLTQPITIDGGGKTDTLVLDASNGSPLSPRLTLNGSFTTGALAIGANQKVVLGGSGNALSVSSLNISSPGSMDLAGDTLKVAYGSGADPDALVRSLVLAGRGGSSGIFSSTLGTGQAVGYVDNPSTQTELVKATPIGDANLDGVVDAADFAILAANQNKSGTEWSTGDFNDDGKTDQADYQLVAQFVKVPTVSSFVVNDGSSQRSMVKSLSVHFNEPVTLTSSAITLSTAGGTPVIVQFSTLDQQTYVLSFSGSQFIAGSLADGRYLLTVHANEATDAGKQPLYVDETFTFFRLFGDFNGDGIVNNADYFKFNKVFGKSSSDPSFMSLFDYNGDGTINNSDYFQFNKRFGMKLG